MAKAKALPEKELFPNWRRPSPLLDRRPSDFGQVTREGNKAVNTFIGHAVNPLLWVRHHQATSLFWRELGYRPNILFPTTYNEKMFWRRLFDHNPAFVTFSDKIAVKNVFAAISNPVATPKTLWHGGEVEAFPDDLMHRDVVAKHNAGYNQNWFFAERGHDRHAFETEARKWLAKPFGAHERQWAYAQVPRQIMAEEVISHHPADMHEIKVQMVGGRVYYAMIYVGEKTQDSRSAIFDAHGNRLSVTNSVTPNRPSHALPASYEVPDCYGDAMAAASEIAQDLDYVRVDFMVCDGKLFGGEVTVYPSAGLMTNSDPAVLQDIADQWPLDRSWFVSTKQSGVMEQYRRRLIAHLAAQPTRTARPLEPA